MRGAIDEIIPAARRVDVHLDDARVRRHAEAVEARILRRLVAFEDHRRIHGFGGRFDRGDQLEVVLELVGGRHEYIEHAVARLGAHRGARDLGRGLEDSGAESGATTPSRGAPTCVPCALAPAAFPAASAARSSSVSPMNWRRISAACRQRARRAPSDPAHGCTGSLPC